MRCPKCGADLYVRVVQTNDHTVTASEYYDVSGHSFSIEVLASVLFPDRPLAPDEAEETESKARRYGRFRCGHVKIPQAAKAGRCAICARERATQPPRRSWAKVFA